MIARLLRALRRMHHLAHVKDLDWQIRVHEAHLAALPTEIRRINELRRFHQGRAATLADMRSRVNFNLGQSRQSARRST
jgi:hypothetical protein